MQKLFLAYISRIARNLSISRWRVQHAQRRSCELDYLLSELDDCIPDTSSIEDIFDEHMLSDALNQWLLFLEERDRKLFMRRYWHGYSVKKLSFQYGKTPTQLGSHLYRLRQQLRCYLEKEGIYL